MSGDFDQASLAARFAAIDERLMRIERHLALGSQTQDVTFTSPTLSLPEDVVALKRAGDLIGAIKRYRELTGADLRAAKDAVEGM
jgi:ribosomal protein L7/L12